MAQQNRDYKRSVRVESDSYVNRNRAIRWFTLIATPIGIVTVLTIFMSLVFGRFIQIPGTTGFLLLISILITTELFARISPRFWVVIPQMQFFVTLNPLKNFFNFKKKAAERDSANDPNVIYGPGGDGPALPWEQRSEKSNGPLDVITIPWTEEVPGKDSRLIVSGSYQFKVNLSEANRFIGIDESTIKGGVIDLIKSDVSDRLSNKGADAAKGEIGELNKAISKKFGVTTGQDPEQEVDEFEHQYGIISVMVTISGIDLPEAVQKTRDAQDEAKQVAQGVANLYLMTVEELEKKVANKDIPLQEYNEMVDRFAAFSDNATMNIQALKINNPAQIAEVFARVFAGKQSGNQ